MSATTTAAAPVRRPRVRPTPKAALLAVLMTILLVFAVVPIREYFAQRSDIAGLQRKESQLESANAALKGRIAKLRDPAVLERLARECLGMAKPGEAPFVALRKGGGPPNPPRC